MKPKTFETQRNRGSGGRGIARSLSDCARSKIITLTLDRPITRSKDLTNPPPPLFLCVSKVLGFSILAIFGNFGDPGNCLNLHSFPPEKNPERLLFPGVK